MLTSGTGEPLYLQLKNQLLDDISAGVYTKGQRIPTENELAQTFSVSRITVRKALKELEQEGLLVRRQGKGTFVADPSLRRDILHNSSFTEICRSAGLTPGARTIKSVIEDATSSDVAGRGISCSFRPSVPGFCCIFFLRITSPWPSNFPAFPNASHFLLRRT